MEHLRPDIRVPQSGIGKIPGPIAAAEYFPPLSGEREAARRGDKYREKLFILFRFGLPGNTIPADPIRQILCDPRVYAGISPL